MGGSPLVTNLSDDQLESLCGGSALYRQSQQAGSSEVSDFSQARTETSKHIERAQDELRTRLLSGGVFKTLILKLAVLEHEFSTNSNLRSLLDPNTGVAVICSLQDSARRTFLQLTQFCSPDLGPAGDAERVNFLKYILPSPEVLFSQNCALKPAFSWHMIRDSLPPFARSFGAESEEILKKLSELVGRVLPGLEEKDAPDWWGAEHKGEKVPQFSGLTLKFYITFWRLQLYDLQYPEERYKAEEKRIDVQIGAMSDQLEKASKRARQTTREHERDQRRTARDEITRLKDLKKKLNLEFQQHKVSQSEVNDKLKEESRFWWTHVGPAATNAFVDHFIAPRVVMSPRDALFCARFCICLTMWLAPRGFQCLDFYNVWTSKLAAQVR
jgi:hypothetical protein